jgi:hypothetical protein
MDGSYPTNCGGARFNDSIPEQAIGMPVMTTCASSLPPSLPPSLLPSLSSFLSSSLSSALFFAAVVAKLRSDLTYIPPSLPPYLPTYLPTYLPPSDWPNFQYDVEDGGELYDNLWEHEW